MFPTPQVGKIMLSKKTDVWEMSDMAEHEDLRGRRLYEAMMAIKPEGLVETDWAARAGVNRGFFTNLKTQPISPRSVTLRKLLQHIGRSEAELYLAADGADVAPIESMDKVPDRLPTRHSSGGDTVEITQLDLALPMGPGAEIDDYIEETAVQFDIALLQSFTRSPFHRLRLLKGVGDSMQPTLRDGDLVLIDTTYDRLDFEDKIWAVRIRGLGAVKRLRSAAKGKVRVISDNPGLPNDIVDEKDIVILGRVVGAIRVM